MYPLPEPSSPPINSGPGHPMPKPPPPDYNTDSGAIDTAVMVSIISLLTSLTSLIGFFSTTVLAWRKEKRETLSSELEIKKKELE